MTTARQVATRIAERRAARVERRGVDLFDAETFGPPAVERARPRQAGELRKIVRWVGRHQWPAQVVLWLAAVAGAAVVFVFGLLVGAGVACWPPFQYES